MTLPRRSRLHSGWIARTIKRIANYHYYRSLGQGVRESWDKAGNTIE